MKTIKYTYLKLVMNTQIEYDIDYPCEISDEDTFITNANYKDMDGLFFLNNDLLTEHLYNGQVYCYNKLIYGQQQK